MGPTTGNLQTKKNQSDDEVNKSIDLRRRECSSKEYDRRRVVIWGGGFKYMYLDIATYI